MTEASIERQRLAELQEQVKSRSSVLHYTHGAVSLLLCSMFGGAGVRLWWEYGPTPWAMTASLVGIALFVYAAVRLVLGRSAMSLEKQRFAELQTLRKRLGFDEPSSMLP